jgi:hypothetical protein
LASIGEEGLAPLDKVRGLLLDFLSHKYPAVRVAAVEAFWQMADVAVKPDLQAALKKETHQEVRANLEHVIRLFE